MTLRWVSHERCHQTRIEDRNRNCSKPLLREASHFDLCGIFSVFLCHSPQFPEASANLLESLLPPLIGLLPQYNHRKNRLLVAGTELLQIVVCGLGFYGFLFYGLHTRLGFDIAIRCWTVVGHSLTLLCFCDVFQPTETAKGWTAEGTAHASAGNLTFCVASSYLHVRSSQATAFGSALSCVFWSDKFGPRWTFSMNFKWTEKLIQICSLNDPPYGMEVFFGLMFCVAVVYEVLWPLCVFIRIAFSLVYSSLWCQVSAIPYLCFVIQRSESAAGGERLSIRREKKDKAFAHQRDAFPNRTRKIQKKISQ